jgi:hypothetical protein
MVALCAAMFRESDEEREALLKKYQVGAEVELTSEVVGEGTGYPEDHRERPLGSAQPRYVVEEPPPEERAPPPEEPASQPRSASRKSKFDSPPLEESTYGCCLCQWWTGYPE